MLLLRMRITGDCSKVILFPIGNLKNGTITIFSFEVCSLHPGHNKKVQIDNDQEMAQSERYSHSINRGVGKTFLLDNKT